MGNLVTVNKIKARKAVLKKGVVYIEKLPPAPPGGGGGWLVVSGYGDGNNRLFQRRSFPRRIVNELMLGAQWEEMKAMLKGGNTFGLAFKEKMEALKDALTSSEGSSQLPGGNACASIVQAVVDDGLFTVPVVQSLALVGPSVLAA